MEQVASFYDEMWQRESEYTRNGRKPVSRRFRWVGFARAPLLATQSSQSCSILFTNALYSNVVRYSILVNEVSSLLSQNQFSVLFALQKTHEGLTQREIAENAGLALGTVNAVVRECAALGYIVDRQLSSKGLEALQPYRVDNAVIMAAGLAQRFAPISYEKPKGLLRVRGDVLIERQIKQLHEAGIMDISVVVGYKKEYFFYLAEKYGVEIVINDEYATRNNNGTLWAVRNRLANTYICSSDNYFTSNPFETYVYQSYYSAQFVEGTTDEWCIETAQNGLITGVEIGGEDSWIMLGHAYFDRDFSKHFREILETVYTRPETVGKLWEEIFIDHLDVLPMVVRPYPEGLINEFDSLDELQGFDPLFIENVDSEVFDNIVDVLDTTRSEVGNFYPLKQGITNLSCHFSVGDEEYVYRYPGVGTDKMINRGAEQAALELASDLGLDSTFMHMDAKRGWKISRFIPEARNLDVSNPQELSNAMKMLRTLHHSDATLDRHFDFIDEGLRYESLLLQHGPIDLPGYQELRTKVLRLKEYADADGFPLVPGHNDFFHLNFLVESSNEMHLIDWEYAGMSDEANDFGTLTVCSELTEDQANQALEYYFGREASPRERRHFWSYVVFAGWCWYIWALVKEAEGDNVGEWLYIYYKHAVTYVDRLLGEYEDVSEVVAP